MKGSCSWKHTSFKVHYVNVKLDGPHPFLIEFYAIRIWLYVLTTFAGCLA